MDVADSERLRIALAVVVAAMLCLGMLSRLARWSPVNATPRERAPIEMRIVEIPPPEPSPVGVRTRPAKDPARPAMRRPPRVAATDPVKSMQTAQAAPRVAAAPARQPRNDDAPLSTAPVPAVARPTPSDTQRLSSSTASSHDSAPSTPGTQARVLAQPLPVLPDDLREQGYRVTAVARFDVHSDGSFDVALVKPTQNPRLNQILLETLHRWRFSPAMENGRPVESEQEVRVHFSVS